MPAVRVNQRTVLVNPDLGDAVAGWCRFCTRGCLSMTRKPIWIARAARLTAWPADAGSGGACGGRSRVGGMNGARAKVRRCGGPEGHGGGR